MPLIKVTEEQLEAMGANIFSNVENDFAEKNITGDFLIWLMVSKKQSQEQILNTCKNPAQEFAEYQTFRSRVPLDPKNPLSPEERRVAGQVIEWKLPEADYTSPEDVKKVAPLLTVTRRILETVGARAQDPSEIRDQAAVFAGVHDTIKEGYKQRTARLYNTNDIILSDPEASLRKRYVLKDLAGLNYKDAMALLVRRGATFGVNEKPTENAKNIEKEIFFPTFIGKDKKRHQKKGNRQNVRDFLTLGSASDVGKTLYSGKKELFSTEITREKAKLEEKFEKRNKEVKDRKQQEFQQELDKQRVKEARARAREKNQKNLLVSAVESAFRNLGKKKDADSGRDKVERRAAEVRASLAEKKKELPRCFSSYRILHSGYFAICRPEKEMVDCLAKSIASIIAEKQGKPFDLDEIHRVAKYTKENLKLDELNAAELEEALGNERSIRAFAAERMDLLYGVEKEERETYQIEMKMLKRSIEIIIEDDPNHVAPEFRRYADAVNRAASLDPKKAKNSDYEQANLNLINSAILYQKGRKSVSRNDDRNDRFNSTLDGMAILRRCVGSGAMFRIRPAVDRINHVRGFGDGDITSPDAVDLDRLGRVHLQRRYGLKVSAIKDQIAAEQKAEQGKAAKKAGKGMLPG